MVDRFLDTVSGLISLPLWRRIEGGPATWHPGIKAELRPTLHFFNALCQSFSENTSLCKRRSVATFCSFCGKPHRKTDHTEKQKWCVDIVNGAYCA